MSVDDRSCCLGHRLVLLFAPSVVVNYVLRWDAIIPLAPARSGDPHRARPIGIYQAGPTEIWRYRDAI